MDTANSVMAGILGGCHLRVPSLKYRQACGAGPWHAHVGPFRPAVWDARDLRLSGRSRISGAAAAAPAAADSLPPPQIAGEIPEGFCAPFVLHCALARVMRAVGRPPRDDLPYECLQAVPWRGPQIKVRSLRGVCDRYDSITNSMRIIYGPSHLAVGAGLQAI